MVATSQTVMVEGPTVGSQTSNDQIETVESKESIQDLVDDLTGKVEMVDEINNKLLKDHEAKVGGTTATMVAIHKREVKQLVLKDLWDVDQTTWEHVHDM